MGKDLVQIEGFKDLQQMLAKVGDTRTLRRLTIPVLKAAARPTLAAAKSMAPVGTRFRTRRSAGKPAATYAPGNLKRSLGILTVKDRKNAAIVVAVRAGKNRKNDGYYGHMVEGGTVNMPAQPFMGPAFRKTRGQVSKSAERKVERVIQTQIHKAGL